MRLPVSLLLLILSGSVSALARDNPVLREHPSHDSEQQSGAVSSVEEDAAVPVPAASEKALRYYNTGNALWMVDQIWGLLVPALFLFTGFSGKIRVLAHRIGRRWFIVIGVYLLIFSIINFILDFPLAYYQEFVRQHDYGLSNQTLGKWLGDSLKGLMVELIAGFLFLWVPYLLLEKSLRRWWLYAGLLALPFLMFVMLVSSIWIDPLFNHFGPMRDK